MRQFQQKFALVFAMLLAIEGVVFAQSAHALWNEENILTQVIYKDETDSEVGVDLGFDLETGNLGTASNVELYRGTYGLSNFAPGTVWEDLHLAFVGRGPSNFVYFSTTKKTAPEIGSSSFSSCSGALTAAVAGGYLQASSTNLAVILANSDTGNSYFTGQNANGTSPGAFTGLNKGYSDGTYGEASLAPLADGAYVDMYLYCVEKVGRQGVFVPGNGTPYTAIIRVKREGNQLVTILNPPGSVEPVDTEGPVTSGMTVTPASIVEGATASIQLSATVSDAGKGDNTIQAAEYFTNTPGTAGTGTAMTGGFSAISVTVSAGVNTAAWVAANSPYKLYVHGQDSKGNWNSTFASIDVTVTEEVVEDTVGPVVSGVTANPQSVIEGGTASIQLSATVSDAGKGESTIEAVEYFVNTPGTAGTGTAMTGSFDGVSVNVSATVSTSAWKAAESPYTLYIRGKDSKGNWSADLASVEVTVTEETQEDTAGPVTTGLTATPQSVVEGVTTSIQLSATVSDAETGNNTIQAAEYFIKFQGAGGTGTPMTGDFDAVSVSVSAEVNTSDWKAISSPYEIYVRGKDSKGNWNNALVAVAVTVTPEEQDDCPDDPNKTAPGECGCGVPDTDSDADGTADCNDGCPNDPNKTAPGECGCGVAEGTCPVFTVAPELESPANRTAVATIAPELIIKNVTELSGETASYTFEVYKDESLTLPLVISTIPADSAASTKWARWEEAVEPLKEDNWYFWRAQGTNGVSATPWMATARFQVNTVNSAPKAPGISGPVDQATVATRMPVLTVINAEDEVSSTRTYEFAVYADGSMVTLVSGISGIEESQDGSTTSWTVPTELSNKTWYWWRARAIEAGEGGLTGSWSQLSSFYIDTLEVQLPTPVIVSPAEGAQLNRNNVVLKIGAVEYQGTEVPVYRFELDSVSSFNGPDKISSADIAGGNEIVQWDPNSVGGTVLLEYDTTYYWRAIAFQGDIFSESWVSSQFKTLPVQPCTLLKPYSGAVVNTLTPTLQVNNSSDNSDVDHYTFEVSGPTGSQVYTANIAPGAGSTSVTLPTGILLDNTAYAWRVRAVTGTKLSAWMPARFSVNTQASGAVDVTVVLSEIVSPSQTDTTELSITDWNSSLYGVAMEIPPGAIAESQSFTIGAPVGVSGPEKGLGPVVHLGPSGVDFLVPVIVHIPYTKNGKTPVVMTRSNTSGEWEVLSADKIISTTDTEITINVSHFSMFAVAEKRDNPIENKSGGGSSGCFINTLFE